MSIPHGWKRNIGIKRAYKRNEVCCESLKYISKQDKRSRSVYQTVNSNKSAVVQKIKPDGTL